MLGVVVLEGKVLVLQQGQNKLLVLVAQEHGRRLVQLLLDLATILRLLLFTRRFSSLIILSYLLVKRPFSSSDSSFNSSLSR